MPWRRVDVDEQRMQFVIRVTGGVERITALCREFGISRPTGYLWRRRYQQTRSLTELGERSRQPHHSPARTPDWKEQRVVALRQQTGWGAKKLRVLLREEERIALPVRTIHRILERHDLVSGDAKAPAPGRFERGAPNELWQMDSKGKYPLADGECHPLSILDDHSRYAVGLYALPALSGKQAHRCLVETFRRYGVPQSMLMDHGSLWWSGFNGWGLTRLSVQLIEQGIRLLYGRVRHPQTQGKVERFHRTLGQALRHRGVPARFEQWPEALAEFQWSYNQRRPHEALDMQRPVDRYQRSPRNYQERVADWDYPAGSDVRRLNSQGMLAEQRHRWFVCGALADQRVRVERFDGKLLVSYRHMYIREIDIERRYSRALVVERDATAEGAPVALRAPCAPSAEERSANGDPKV
ncbi:MAG: IS481 family transposase [Candidatus Acidiferrales bacterium]